MKRYMLTKAILGGRAKSAQLALELVIFAMTREVQDEGWAIKGKERTRLAAEGFGRDQSEKRTELVHL